MRESFGSRRVGFLFNHDALHQIAHCAGIMGQLALTGPEIEVVAAYARLETRQHIEGLLPTGATERIEWVELKIPSAFDFLAKPLDRLAPIRRLARLHYNLDFFSHLDVLVSPERTCLWIKRKLGAHSPRFVFVPHGAGDRSVTYHPSLAQFDIMLVSGPKVADEMVRHGLITRDRIRIIGYPKFDTVDISVRKRFFDNDNPVFLYNPHFDPCLSSWYDMGEQVMGYFLDHADRYNLIVAPHVMLFRKKIHYSIEYRRARIRPSIADRFYNAPNIHVDVGSKNLIDMTYTMASDVYIGDVSSQVYEFLIHRGACYFLDVQKTEPLGGAPRYEFWQNGEVLQDAAQLAIHIPQWRKNAARHLPEQNRLFAYTMDYRRDERADTRGAAALREYMHNSTL